MRLGIDLGTTRTIVAACDRGNYPVVGLSTEQGDMVDYLPTRVAEQDGELVYGHAAMRLALEGAPNLRSFKRLLGRHASTHPVRIGAVQRSLGDVLTGFIEHVLSQLRQASNLDPADPIEQVVVSVPANAHSSQRMATLDAYRRAGVDVAAMLNEPSAAGIEYAHRHRGTLNQKRDHVAVYDLGGGTFDAALVMLAGDQHEVVDTCGIRELGGDDFDALLLSMALDAAGVADPGAATGALLDECRAAKEAIHPSTRRVVLTLEALGDRAPAEPAVIDVDHYYERARPLVEETVEALCEVIAAGAAEATVDELKAHTAEAGVAGVYVVGGASSLPVVARVLRERFGRRVHRSVHSAGAIAIGLAIAADEARPGQVAERLTRHLGVFREAAGGEHVVFDPIFARGTAMPAPDEAPLTATRRYRPAHNLGHFRFVECGRINAHGEPTGDISPHELVRFAFDRTLRDASGPLGVQRLDREGPEIEERYEVDASGVVSVTIADLDDGFSQRFVL
jgi:molecular chaperone DnaK (HSP70)